MLAPTPPVPPKFWDIAMSYVCATMSFNYNSVIGTSPYNMLTKKHVVVKHLHAFWSKCWVHIPTKDAGGKVGHPRAYQARFIGYDMTTTLEPTYKVIEILDKGKYGAVRISKDVIFDLPEEIVQQMEAATAIEPPQIHEAAQTPVPAPQAAHNQTPASAQSNMNAPSQVDPNHSMRRRSGTNTVTTPAGPHPGAHSGAPKRASPPRIPDSAPIHPANTVDSIGANTSIVSWETEDAVYWYAIQATYPEQLMTVVETSHYDQIKTLPDTGFPKSFWRAMKDPPWAKAIDTELMKFEVNSCFNIVPFTGQHLVPMMWLFSVKNDGTKKARLVDRGDKIIPNVDFDPEAVYCGNVAACSIKLAMVIAATYKLVMRGGDPVGAYLITRANKDFPVFIITPQGYNIPPGYCIQAVGHLNGFPPAGQNFSIEFDKCLRECGYKNIPWDLKLFFKWTHSNKPMITIAHSDDFRWFGPPNHIHEWDAVIQAFNKHGY